MGKTFKPDVLSKKRYKNEGQVESYLLENAFEGIIDKAQFDMVQIELERRKDIGKGEEGLRIRPRDEPDPLRTSGPVHTLLVPQRGDIRERDQVRQEDKTPAGTCGRRRDGERTLHQEPDEGVRRLGCHRGGGPRGPRDRSLHGDDPESVVLVPRLCGAVRQKVGMT